MAKIIGPLMSIEAHGTIGSRLTFSSRKTGQQVRFQNRQVDVKSSAQLTQRETFLFAKKIWNNMTAAQRAEYENYTIANQLNLTGYNYFIKKNMDLAELTKEAVLYLPFNSVSSGVTPDISGEGNNGTVTGATLTSGKFGNAFLFDNTDDKIIVDHAANLSLTEWTIATWVNVNTFTTAGIIAKGEIGSSWRNYQIAIVYETFRATYENIVGTDANDCISDTIQTHTDYFVAFTYKNRVSKLYLQAEKVDEKAQTIDPVTNSANVQIGRYTDSSRLWALDGKMDTPMIFQTELNQSELQRLMLLTKPVSLL